ncbi:hypothetical protein Peur_046085 [Populus x canadensis]
MLSSQDYQQFRLLINCWKNEQVPGAVMETKIVGMREALIELQLKVAEIATFHSSHYLDWYSLHEMVRMSACCTTVLFLLLVPLRGCDCLIMCTANLLESRTRFAFSLVVSVYLDVHLSSTFQRKCNSYPLACKELHQEHPLCVY